MCDDLDWIAAFHELLVKVKQLTIRNKCEHFTFSQQKAFVPDLLVTVHEMERF
jgi:hypothetical protein